MRPRFVEQRVREALSDTRVVLISGPRQAGKTTLAEKLAGDGMPEACGKRFTLGLVLYDHDTVVPFGERLFAAPISTLWM